MSNNIAKLAKEIHKRDNKKRIGPCVGTVVNPNTPVTVSICDGAVLLEQGENAHLCHDLTERAHEAKAQDDSVTVTYENEQKKTVKINTDEKLKICIKNVLKRGDQVLCIPCSGEQTWVIVDKVVG